MKKKHFRRPYFFAALAGSTRIFWGQTFCGAFWAIISASGDSNFAYTLNKIFHLHRVPKLAPPLQTRLIQFVVHGSQRNIVHCSILTLLTVTQITLVCAQCNVIMTSEFVYINIRLMHCYWQKDQAAPYPP